MKKILILLLCLLMLPVSVQGQAVPDTVRLYVSPEGNDKYPGSEQLPFATVEKAVKTVRLLEEKAVVYLRQGTYEGGLNLDERDTRVMYRSYPGEQAVVTAKEDQPALSMKGCGTVTIQGISFSGGTEAVISQCEEAQIFDCTFSEMKQGLCIDGNARIEGNTLTEIKETAIYAMSGNRKTLEKGTCVIVNNTISRFALEDSTKPGVLLDGVGIVFSDNDLFDSKGTAVRIAGNEHTVTRNKISNIEAEAAVQTVSDVTARGSVIQENLIVDCTQTGILLEDFSSGIKVENNVFCRLKQGVIMRGGRHNRFSQNVSVDCEHFLMLESAKLPQSMKKKMKESMEAVSYSEGIWEKTYPELLTFLMDSPQTPKGNQVLGNAVFQTKATEATIKIKSNNIVESDIVWEDSSVFADYQQGDFSNEYVDCSVIGTKKAVQSAEKALIVMLNSPYAFHHGTTTLIDPANRQVTPLLEQGRTLVPLRFIAESMGATVLWNQETKTARVEYEDAVLELTIGSEVLTVNGEERMLDVPAGTKNDRTMLPIRAVAENLGLAVTWNETGLIVIGKETVGLADPLVLNGLVRLVLVQ